MELLVLFSALVFNMGRVGDCGERNRLRLAIEFEPGEFQITILLRWIDLITTDRLRAILATPKSIHNSIGGHDDLQTTSFPGIAQTNEVSFDQAAPNKKSETAPSGGTQ
jgi:hypothetical protein